MGMKLASYLKIWCHENSVHPSKIWVSKSCVEGTAGLTMSSTLVEADSQLLE